MGRKKRKSQFVSPYFEKQSRARRKQIGNKQRVFSPNIVKTSQIRAIAERIFGNPYGFKAKEDD